MNANHSHSQTYSIYAKMIHMGLAIFGVAAFLTGESAEHGANSSGYLLHAYLGLSLATFIFLRFIGGFIGTGCMRFSGWSPFSRHQWNQAWQDLNSLIRLTIPRRNMHEGLAGLVQAFGLAIFCWMGATGCILFLMGSGPESSLFELVEEAHEIGEGAIPLFLALHVGAVIVHLLASEPIWKRMWITRASKD